MSDITLRIVSGPELSKDSDGWEHNVYEIELSNGHRRMYTPWMQGIGITEDPSAKEVLESLILDAQGFWNAARGSYTPEAFQDWCDEYGYDSDSRKIYALYERIGALTDDLSGFLGAAEFEAVMDKEPEEAAKQLASVSTEDDS